MQWQRDRMTPITHWFLFFFFLLYTFIPNTGFVCFASLLLLPIALLEKYYARKNHISNEVLPQRIGQVFGDKGVYIRPIMDIWMTGCGGRKVLEAIYLERRIISQSVGTLFFSGLMTLNLGIGTILTLHHPEYLFGILIAVASVAYLLSEIYLCYSRSGLIDTNLLPLKSTIDGWRGASSVTSYDGVSHDIMIPVVITLFFFAVCVTGIVLMVPTMKSILADLVPDVDGSFLSTQILLFVLSLLVYLLGVILRLMAKSRSKNARNDLEELFQLADSAFDQYVRRSIIKDPDFQRRPEEDENGFC